MKHIWQLLHNATIEAPDLLKVPAFHLDYVDVTRQVMGNAFTGIYLNIVNRFKANATASEVELLGHGMLSFLTDLDMALDTHEHFTLKKWLDDAKAWGESTSALDEMAFNARSQVTVWGVISYLDDYAAKAWSGLVRSYYGRRWKLFIESLVDARKRNVALDEDAMESKIGDFETSWQYRGYRSETCDKPQDIRSVAETLVTRWPEVFA